MKIIVTGKNKRIIRDVCEHCEEDRGYPVVKCRPDKTALFDVMYKEMPNVIIICMGNETSEDVKVYDILKETTKSGILQVFVVANEEDKKIFQKYTGLQKVYFFPRPVSMFAIYAKLMEIAEKYGDKVASSVELFENPAISEDTGRKRILVVDDDSQQLMHIKELLKEFYDVSVVKSGEDCFRFLEKKGADLILLDYLMPKMDGPEVLNGLRSVEETADIPVMFLTGMTEKNTVIKTLTELKPQGYIVKPSKKSELVAKIIDVLG